MKGERSVSSEVDMKLLEEEITSIGIRHRIGDAEVLRWRHTWSEIT
jgi:hypothetical protein